MRPNVYYSDPAVTLWHGDSIETMRELPDNSVDSIVTDPPYGLGFMGKNWDALPPGEEWAAECLRVLKPGGHLLAFGGSRTWHRLAVAVEDAGFEIRDSIAWLYGSGFPKSHDVSKAIDKAAGAEREVLGPKRGPDGQSYESMRKKLPGTQHEGWERPFQHDPAARKAVNMETAPATDEAKQWHGWGTALKPAFEPVVVGRKPLIGTVAQNVQRHGTGALNIDATRIATGDKLGGGANTGMTAETRHEGFARPWMKDDAARDAAATRSRENTARAESLGRWPANVVLDETTAPLLDQQSGTLKSGAHKSAHSRATVGGNGLTHGAMAGVTGPENEANEGGASRFFYVAKAPKRERPVVDGVAHPTVKPLALMRWLVKLVTPPGGVVLDPFEGSGTTLEACLLEGFQHIGIEREADYLPLTLSRVERQGGTLDVAA